MTEDEKIVPTCAHDIPLTEGCGDCWGSDTPRDEEGNSLGRCVDSSGQHVEKQLS